MLYFAIAVTALLLLTLSIIAGVAVRNAQQKGALTRALNMMLFSVRVPRESPKDGDQKKQEKELISIMEQLFSSFSNFHSKGWTKFIYGEPYISLELAVHHVGEEIHFYVGVPKPYSQIVEKQILGLYPTAEVTPTKDYNIFNPQGAAAGARLRLTKNPLLPIRTYQKLEADPLGEILTGMSKLKEEGEGAALQILIKPSHNKKLKKLSTKVAQELQKGRTFAQALNFAGQTEIGKASKQVLFELTEVTPPKPPGTPPNNQFNDMQRRATPYHEELTKAIISKASKPVFDTNMRIIASAENEMRASEIVHDIENAFVQLTSPDLNELKPNRLTGKALKKLVFDFSFRLFNANEVAYLSTEELTSIYHYPIASTAAPRVKFVRSKAAEPPPDLPKEGIILGKNVFRGQETLVRMSKEDRRRHLYMIGQTGTGKSTFMKALIKQDIENGEGLAIVDPHGELIEDILTMIPKERANDVIVFNPGDISRPLGLNILEIDPTQPQQKSFVVDDFYKILKMIYKDSPEAFGPIFEKFFKNTIMLLLDDYQNEIPTIAEISRVFADKAYRDSKLERETNPEIVRFWRFEAEKMSGDWSLPNMSGYITSKFSPFILNEYVRPIITQQKSSFNVRQVMDERKILLINLSKGLIGDLNASLLGMMMVSKILVAALSRVDIPNEEDRKDFYLYIDEFQNFTTDSIATILSEARKYRLDLIIAHQFIKQLQDNIKNAVFGNVGSLLAFRIGEEDAEFLKTRFEPVFSPHDLVNIDNFNAYVKLLIQNKTARPFNIQVIAPEKGDPTIAQAIKELSRNTYGRDRDIVEKDFRDRQERSITTQPTP